jgi:hypothetical protein
VWEVRDGWTGAGGGAGVLGVAGAWDATLADRAGRGWLRKMFPQIVVDLVAAAEKQAAAGAGPRHRPGEQAPMGAIEPPPGTGTDAGPGSDG